MATSKVPVIVTILLLGRGTMTYKRIHLIEGEPITLKVWDVKQQAGRHGSGAVAVSLRLIHK